jgi:hypothetical protein
MTGQHNPYRASDITLAALAAAGVIVVAWQAYRFAAPFGLLRDWQLGWFGQYFPGLSVLVLLALVAVVAGLAPLVTSRKRAALMDGERARRRARQLYLVLAFVTAAFAAGLVAALVPLLTMPNDRAPAVRVDARAAGLAQGPATLVGRIVPGKAIVFRRTVGLATRRVQFVAVERGAGATKARYLIEVPTATAGDNRTEHRGLLVQNALPADAILALEESGQPVARPYAVLFMTAASASWAASAFVVQLGLLTLVSLAATIIQRGIARRLAAPPRLPGGAA